MKDQSSTPKWAMPTFVGLAVALFAEYFVYRLFESGGSPLAWVVLVLELATACAIVVLIIIMGIRAFKMADKDERDEVEREVEGEVIKILRSQSADTAVNRVALERKVKKRRAKKLATRKGLEEQLGDGYKIEKKADTLACFALIILALCVFGLGYWWQAYGQYGPYEALIQGGKSTALAIVCFIGCIIDAILWNDSRVLKKCAIKSYEQENEDLKLAKSKRERQKIEKGKIKYTKEPRDKV